MAHYLVTGGCGFIGSHLVEALLKRGDKVTVLDNLSTGKKSNLPQGALVVVGSVCDQDLVQQLMNNVDGCFHLAAVSSVQKCTEAWVESHTVNLTGTLTVFQAARSVRERSIPVVFTSSAAVYGNAQSLPLKESIQIQPLSAYGADKYACELQAYVASHTFGLPTIGLRPFNIYGPKQDPSSAYSGVISIFADKLKQGQPLTIYGDGEQTRDFVFVKDAVNYFLAAMSCPEKHGQVVNICRGQQTSLLQLAETLAVIMNRDPVLQFELARVGDIQHSFGDPGLAKRLLNVEARCELAIGLNELCQYMDAVHA